MIYVIIGTMAEYIKMFPVMRLFDQRKIGYRFVHTGQHAKIIEKNILKANLRKPNFYLSPKRKNLENIGQFLIWIPQVLLRARKLPIKRGDYVIVQGDAMSTFLGFLIGKFYGAKVVHVEAGMRTHNFFNPFPEEIIRTIISNLADVCFCPTKNEVKNIRGKAKVYVTEGNTVFDAVRFARNLKHSEEIEELKKKKFVLFLIHRTENLILRRNLQKIMEILEMILKKNFLVIWPMHDPTIYELKRKGFWPKILEFKKKYHLQTKTFFEYVDFIRAVSLVQFVASDEGGLQNETYFLNKPMLVLRMATSVKPGLGETAYLSYLSKKRVKYFLGNFQKFKRKTKISGSPSKIVADYFDEKEKK